MNAVHQLRRPGLRTGFTLLELLIVIAIMGVLMGLLFPSVRRVRAQAHLAACQNNLRQIGAALLIYEDDHGGMLPDRITTGNFFFRMRPGLVSEAEKGALPETYGLAAVLHGIRPGQDLSGGLPKAKYLPADSDVWVCPSQTEFMKGLGNTYAFSNAPGLSAWNRPMRAAKGDGVFAWDNHTYYPGLSGFRGPFNGYVIPTEKRTYPHRWAGKWEGAVCELKMDGDVTVKVFK